MPVTEKLEDNGRLPDIETSFHDFLNSGEFSKLTSLFGDFPARPVVQKTSVSNTPFELYPAWQKWHAFSPQACEAALEKPQLYAVAYDTWVSQLRYWIPSVSRNPLPVRAFGTEKQNSAVHTLVKNLFELSVGCMSSLDQRVDPKTIPLADLMDLGRKQLAYGGMPLRYDSPWGKSPETSKRTGAFATDFVPLVLLPPHVTAHAQQQEAMRNNEDTTTIGDRGKFARKFTDVLPGTPSFEERYAAQFATAVSNIQTILAHLNVAAPESMVALLQETASTSADVSASSIPSSLVDSFHMDSTVTSSIFGPKQAHSDILLNSNLAPQIDWKEVSQPEKLADTIIALRLISELIPHLPTYDQRKTQAEQFQNTMRVYQRVEVFQTTSLEEYAKNSLPQKISLKQFFSTLPLQKTPVTLEDLVPYFQSLSTADSVFHEILDEIQRTNDLVFDTQSSAYGPDRKRKEIIKGIVLQFWKNGHQDNLTEWILERISSGANRDNLVSCSEQFHNLGPVLSDAHTKSITHIALRYQDAIADSSLTLPTTRSLLSHLKQLDALHQTVEDNQPAYAQPFLKKVLDYSSLWAPLAYLQSLPDTKGALGNFIVTSWKEPFDRIGLHMDTPEVWTPDIENQDALNYYRAQLILNAVVSYTLNTGIISQETREELLTELFPRSGQTSQFTISDDLGIHHAGVVHTIDRLLAVGKFEFSKPRSSFPFTEIWTGLPFDPQLVSHLIKTGETPPISVHPYRRNDQTAFVMSEETSHELLSTWLALLADKSKDVHDPTTSFLIPFGLDQLLWSDAGAALIAGAHNSRLTRDDVLDANLGNQIDTILFALGLIQGFRYYADLAAQRAIPIAYLSRQDSIRLFEFYPQQRLFDSLRSPESKKENVPNDVSILPGQPLILIGSAGGGKTTFLKSLAHAAYMQKMGAYVFAREGNMPDFDYVLFSLNDDIGYGSRFRKHVERAVEFLDNLFSIQKQDTLHTSNVLALMDELFRGTEDNHAVALIRSFLQVCAHPGVYLAIATHYGQLLDLNAQEKLPFGTQFKSSNFGEYRLTQQHSSQYEPVLKNKRFSPLFRTAFTQLTQRQHPDILPLLESCTELPAHSGFFDPLPVLSDLGFNTNLSIRSGFRRLEIPSFMWLGKDETRETRFLRWLFPILPSTERKAQAYMRANFIDATPEKKKLQEGIKNLAAVGRAIHGGFSISERSETQFREMQHQLMNQIFHTLTTLFDKNAPIQAHPWVAEYLQTLKDALYTTDSSRLSHTIAHSIKGKSEDLLDKLKTGLSQIPNTAHSALIHTFIEKLKEAPNTHTLKTEITNQIEELANLSSFAGWLKQEGFENCRISSGESLVIEDGIYLGDYVRADTVVANSVDIQRGKPTIATGDNESGKSFAAKMVTFNALLGMYTNYALAKKMSMPDYDFIGTTFRAAESTTDDSSSMHEAQEYARIIASIPKGKRSLVVGDEPGSSVSSSEGAPFAALLIHAFSKAGVDVMSTTHYHHLENLLRTISPSIEILPYGFIFSENDTQGHYKAQKGERPGTSRGVQRAMYIFEQLVRENKIIHDQEIREVFKQALSFLEEQSNL